MLKRIMKDLRRKKNPIILQAETDQQGRKSPSLSMVYLSACYEIYANIAGLVCNGNAEIETVSAESVARGVPNICV